MGAAGSSSSGHPPSVPLRPRSEETFIYGTEESCCPEYTNENIRQRTRTSAFDVGEEPRSQGPSPYATFRGEEWCSQRPSAPSLSNLPPPRRETLLTYAAQMTGWQTAEGHSPSFSQQHQEAMELSRAITQLAMANQQLATAHTATLAHLEELYMDLRRERELRKRGFASCMLDEASKKRLTIEQEGDDEDDEERQSMELRLDRLENLQTDDRDTCQNRQRNLRQGDDKKLRSRLEKLERTDDRQGCMGVRRSTENMEARDVDHDRVLSSIDVPECKSESQPLVSRVETTDDEGRTRSVCRIRITHGGQAYDPRSGDETDRSTANLHLEKSEEDSAARKETIRLSEEIERLKGERSEYRSMNERLASDLAVQKAMAKKLTEDYEESKLRREKIESSLQERREEYDNLMEKLDFATKETERLLKEIDAFNTQKDTAEARIFSLEQELQKSLLEKEQIKSMENQKILKLKAQLSEEVSDKKKQIKALEEALDEIQRLKETIKTERKSDDDDASREDVDDLQASPATDRANNIEEFKKELTLKREARQRAITAVSSEMERLRRELDAEKEAHSETSRVLDLLRSAQNDDRTQPQTSETNGSSRKSRIRDQKPDEHELAMKRVEAQRLTSVLKVSDELRNDIRFQIEKVDDLRYQLETEPDQHRYRILSLTEVTNKTRETLHARERCANELKDHLAQILVRLGDRSFLDLKDDVGLECERQLENINSLKSLYNERLKVLTELKEAAVRELADVKERLDHSLKKSECLEEDLRKADEKIDVQDTEISNLESQLGLTKADCRDLQNQMSLINGLFTQMLLGASSADMDLDRLTQLLQENHDLISDMAREESTEAAALPKLLLDLVEQVEGSKGTQKRIEGEGSGTNGETEKKEDDLQQEDIAHNLPKVWRVLLELLSCHAEGSPSAAAASASDPNICYKSVDTPAGPRLVISVSKTYIRLKELILEKKHLEKEMNRMKQLNTHLESKLGEQEKRLSAVSAELSKTWTIVDRMQAQHQQLHTHEKILRYELQQKRKMLQELKQELEYCREKWESARQKNTNTELEWRSLRREFAARKALAVHDSFNNSAESGFSDERGDDTDEEDDAVEGRLRLGPRRKPRKESPRAPTPDTESEQPTDTELSEPKTGSSATLEQRTPTPETEAELDETEAADVTLNAVSVIASGVPQSISESSQGSLDSLDQALTNVIQNLIAINEPSSSTFASPSAEVDVTDDIAKDESSFSESSTTIDSSLAPRVVSRDPESLINNSDSIALSVQDLAPSSSTGDSCQKIEDTDGEKAKTENLLDSSVSHASTVPSSTSTLSVFTIGPFPQSTVTHSIVKNVHFTDSMITGPSNKCFTPVFGAPLTVVKDRFNETGLSEPSSACITPSSQEADSRIIEKRGIRSTEGVVDSDSVSVDSSSSLETVKEFPACSPDEAGKKEGSEMGSSWQEENKVATVKTRTPEEALAAREDRLKRLEEQAKWLMNKMNATSRRGSALSTRLEELHEAYGEPPVPPPMPDVLPSRRLRTNLTDLPRQVPESSPAEGTENSNKLISSSNASPSDNAP
ncbi:uncharacterized protein LOC128889830 isoform X1 [Hylaeus anthracinus]|uniref:uncharacterized protein LOC128889830 isoform X1 n=1 Tax=Hylaeus anthracinus TaxID=313031 RepID=UPI0023B933BE|nr:uncharacterized protein LOC128889830 isoform X1 [Hylaeus anthracinus]XP_054003810.1 uncharacterized protein LOC128889830 isoform X1 [Hylaeus anthracinus]